MTHDFESWEKVRLVFEDVIKLVPKERETAIQTAGLSDIEKDWVRELIGHYESHSVLISHTDREYIHGVLEDKFDEDLIGTQFGAYRILEKIGEGGMGAVFLGERADAAFEKSVAIKLIRRQHSSEFASQAFFSERQILAQLLHPHIARLLDGGTAADGTAFFVMDYIEGEPITVYCDRHRLSIQQRIALVIKLCSAVQYAHQSLVVHRDIKPANILVTQQGDPVLMDFGIAKILRSESSKQDDDPSEPRWFSPNYASPEQIQGKAITTASDIYAMGVLLHELICGVRPYQLPVSSLEDMRHFVGTMTLEKPSQLLKQESQTTLQSISKVRKTEPGKLVSNLRGDLDAILGCALNSDPQKRYPTIQKMADDLQLHLNQFPISVRDHSFLLGARKWLLRNKLAGLALSTTLALACWFLVATHNQNKRIRAERDSAQWAFNLSKDLFTIESNNRTKENTITIRELLEFKAKNGIKMPTHNPRAQRDHLLTWGEIFLANQLTEPANEMIQKALAMCSSQHSVTSSEHGRCLLLQASMQYLQRKHDEAGENLAKAERIFNRNDPKQLASVYHSQAKIFRIRGKREQAVPLFEKALKIRQEHFPENAIQLATSYLELGNTLAQIEEPELAKTHIEEARRLQLAYHPSASQLAMRIHRRLFIIEKKQGRLGEAAKQLESLVDINRRLYGYDSRGTADILKRWADLQFGMKQFEKAELNFFEAMYFGKKYIKKNHPWILGVLHNLALTYQKLDRIEEAEDFFQQAIEGNLAFGEDNHVNLGYHRMRYGALLTDSQRWSEAMEQLCMAQELFLNHGKNPLHEFSIAQVYLARCLIAQKSYEEADIILKEAFPHLRDSDEYERELVISMQEMLLVNSTPQQTQLNH